MTILPFLYLAVQASPNPWQAGGAPSFPSPPPWVGPITLLTAPFTLGRRWRGKAACVYGLVYDTFLTPVGPGSGHIWVRVTWGHPEVTGREPSVGTGGRGQEETAPPALTIQAMFFSPPCPMTRKAISEHCTQDDSNFHNVFLGTQEFARFRLALIQLLGCIKAKSKPHMMKAGSSRLNFYVRIHFKERNLTLVC